MHWGKILLFFLFFYTVMKADSTDSLRSVLKKNRTDTERVKTLNAIAFQKYLTNIKEAYPYCYQALSLAKKSDFPGGMMTSYLYLAYLNKAEGHNDKALCYTDSGIAVAEKYHSEYSKLKFYNEK